MFKTDVRWHEIIRDAFKSYNIILMSDFYQLMQDFHQLQSDGIFPCRPQSQENVTKYILMSVSSLLRNIIQIRPGLQWFQFLRIIRWFLLSFPKSCTSFLYKIVSYNKKWETCKTHGLDLHKLWSVILKILCAVFNGVERLLNFMCEIKAI